MKLPMPDSSVYTKTEVPRTQLTASSDKDVINEVGVKFACNPETNDLCLNVLLNRKQSRLRAELWGLQKHLAKV